MSGHNPNLDKNKPSRGIWILVALGILAIISIPAWYLPYKYNNEIAGQIGDRMGGFTAPFIGLLNAVLVYIAFWQQKKANEDIREEMKKQKEDFDKDKFLERLRQQFEDLKDEIASIRYESTQLNKIWRGSEFFFSISNLKSVVGKGDLSSLHSPSYSLDLGRLDTSMYFILLSFEAIIETIESSPILPEEKRGWMDRVSYLYRSKGVPNIHKLTGMCRIGPVPCSEAHGGLAVCVYRKFLLVKSKLGDSFSEDEQLN